MGEDKLKERFDDGSYEIETIFREKFLQNLNVSIIYMFHCGQVLILWTSGKQLMKSISTCHSSLKTLSELGVTIR